MSNEQYRSISIMIEAQAELLGMSKTEEIDMSLPIQKLFDECLNFISIASFE